MSAPARNCCSASGARTVAGRVPQTSPDYLIEEWIGGGGMGEVFRARQLSRNRPVAIKMMSANSTAGDKAVDYFQREIQVLRDLLMPGGQCHPSIVAFYELFQVDAQFQLVMEYVDGKNALEWTANAEAAACRSPAAPDRPPAALGARLRPFQGLRAPRREAVEPAGHGPGPSAPRQADRLRPGQELCRHRGFTNLTRQGDVGGSIGFLSPDHIREFSDVREPADIYCAGATLFYLLTNKYPYLGFDPRRSDSYEMILEHPPSRCAPSARRSRGAGAGAAEGPEEAAARPMEIGPGHGRCPPAVCAAVSSA